MVLGSLLRSRILRRILYGFGLVAAVLGVGLVVTLVQFDRLNHVFYDLLEQDVELVDDVEHLEQLLSVIQSSKRGYIITGDRDFLQRYERARTEVPRVLREVRDDAKDRPAELVLADRFASSLDRYVTEAPIPEFPYRDRVSLADLAEQFRLGTGTRLAAEAEGYLQELHDAARRDVLTQRQTVLNASVTSRRVAVLSMALAILVAALYGMRVARDLGSALADLQQSIEAMAHGERRVVAVTRPDEIGAVARSFDAMADRLAGAEGSLRSKVREQDETLDELRRTNQALGLAMRVKSDFLATMSHELRTPLNAVIGLSALLLDSPAEQLSPRARQALTTMRNSGEHLLGLLNDILDLAKLDAGRMSIAPAAVDPSPLTRACMATVIPLIGEKPVEVTFHAEPGLPVVKVDPQRLRQVLLNLLSNAVKFTDRGRVTARLRRDGNAVAIEVEDTGIGIDPAEQEHLFEEFHQVASGDDRLYSGTGLGLALSRKMARAMGGDITVVSVPGRGSTFTLRVPTADGPYVPPPEDVARDATHEGSTA